MKRKLEIVIGVVIIAFAILSCFLWVPYCYSNEITGTVTGYKTHLVTIELYDLQCSEIVYLRETVLCPICGGYHFLDIDNNTGCQIKPRHMEDGIVFIPEFINVYIPGSKTKVEK